ncbi:auxin-induced in root cultures protein 12 [Punica granatum]|uniref:Auxin-induced in root cultures protein 12 n=1 Tax=Punica granatum TaxID=22663 RepID=A0A218VQE5_PUNGR|nr:auxin-induced in root cultures protein 12 [Punica granatum]OWM62754.1 hypothetical protein CDL15_Pgr020048 [Punica granatum]
MASLSLPLLLAVPFALVLMVAVTPAESLTCASQKVTESATGRAYTECADLPALGAYLHYTYNATNSSLSVAYLAASTGWISWAINPTLTGMVGAQALMALKPASGPIVAKTYNISSYHSIVEGKLSFDVWDLKADESNGTMRLFGSVKVPKGATSLNQVWQVGSSVNGTQPRIHAMTPDNKNSKSTLDLTDSTTAPTSGGGSTGVPEAAPAPTPTSEAPRILKVISGALLSSLSLWCGLGF